MFVFSEVHNWQGNSSVKQILVFTSEQVKVSFDVEFNRQADTVGRENVNDSGFGAIYKLRVLKRDDGTWISSILCGKTGILIWDDFGKYDNSTLALIVCGKYLSESIISGITNKLWNYAKGRVN